MVSVHYRQRAGNNLFQYVAGHLLSNKQDLYLSSRPSHNGIDFGNFFNIPSAIGKIKLQGDPFTINIKNYLTVYNETKVLTNPLILNDWFQMKEIFWDREQDVKSLFQLTYEYVNPKEVFVICRIGDLLNRREMTPKEFYLESLDKINPNGGYITSDSLDHPFVLDIAKKFNLKIFKTSNPLDIINKAKNFNNLVVGEGTFCWWAAYFCKGENIFLNGRSLLPGINISGLTQKSVHKDPRRHWKYINWDYDLNYVDTESWKNDIKNQMTLKNRLIEYKPIRLTSLVY